MLFFHLPIFVSFSFYPLSYTLKTMSNKELSIFNFILFASPRKTYLPLAAVAENFILTSASGQLAYCQSNVAAWCFSSLLCFQHDIFNFEVEHFFHLNGNYPLEQGKLSFGVAIFIFQMREKLKQKKKKMAGILK